MLCVLKLVYPYDSSFKYDAISSSHPVKYQRGGRDGLDDSSEEPNVCNNRES